MGIGFGVLKLSSREFWSLTPVEFEAALRGLYGDDILAEYPDRDQLVRLMEDFPDMAAKG